MYIEVKKARNTFWISMTAMNIFRPQKLHFIMSYNALLRIRHREVGGGALMHVIKPIDMSGIQRHVT